MTAPIPVEEDDLLQGAANYLLSLPDVVALVGSNQYGPYIWQDAKLINFEEEPAVGIVVTTSAIGITDDAHTSHFERLGIEIWVGAIRDSVTGSVVEHAETRRRLNKVYKVVDRHLHRTDPRIEYWGTVRTHWCERIGGLDKFYAEDGGGTLVGQQFYAVQLD